MIPCASTIYYVTGNNTIIICLHSRKYRSICRQINIKKQQEKITYYTTVTNKIIIYLHSRKYRSSYRQSCIKEQNKR